MNALMKSCEQAIRDVLNQSVAGEQKHDVLEYEEQDLVSRIYHRIACSEPNLLNVFSPCGDKSARLRTNFPTKLLADWKGPNEFLDLVIVKESSTLYKGNLREEHQHMFTLIGVIEAKFAITGRDIKKDLDRICKLLGKFKQAFGILVIAYSWRTTSRRGGKIIGENFEAIRKVRHQDNLLILTEYSGKKTPWTGKVFDKKGLFNVQEKK